MRVGCAPDTLLGGGHEAGRAALEAGRIGTPVGAAAFLGLRQVERFVPDPAAYFSWDAAVLDIGPYYVSQLVTLLGPVTDVVARGTRLQEGRDFPVGVPTTVSAILGFASGVQATLTLSLDVWQHSHPPLEVYGTLGTLTLPDPNFFGGEPRVGDGSGGVGDRAAGRAPLERAEPDAADRQASRTTAGPGSRTWSPRSSRTGRTAPAASWRCTSSRCSNGC